MFERFYLYTLLLQYFVFVQFYGGMASGFWPYKWTQVRWLQTAFFILHRPMAPMNHQPFLFLQHFFFFFCMFEIQNLMTEYV